MGFLVKTIKLFDLNFYSGGFLKTHDFFQPLDQQVEKEGNKFDHILPGGIATYSISQISSSSYSYMNMNQIQSQKVVPKAEGVEISGAQCQSSSINNNNDENSNCSSYTGSGFSLWEESTVKKGKTGKENIAGNRHVVRGKNKLII